MKCVVRKESADQLVKSEVKRKGCGDVKLLEQVWWCKSRPRQQTYESRWKETRRCPASVWGKNDRGKDVTDLAPLSLQVEQCQRSKANGLWC